MNAIIAGHAIAYAPGYATPAPVNGHRVTGLTREAYICQVRTLAVSRLLNLEHRDKLGQAKLVYGAGTGAYRGICYYDAWKNGSTHSFIEIAATGEESALQLAGTTVHELGHALAWLEQKGINVGHGGDWKEACGRLGLTARSASGQAYEVADFEATLWAAIVVLGEPDDGAPNFIGMGGPSWLTGMIAGTARPCPMGKGSRGGKFGPGTGSRLRLWECACPVKVRVASDTFEATCKRCGTDFARVEVEVPA